MMNRASKRWSPAFWLGVLVLCWGVGQVPAHSQEAPWACELLISSQGEDSYTALFLAEDGSHFLGVSGLPFDAKKFKSDHLNGLRDALSKSHPDCTQHLQKFPNADQARPMEDALRAFLEEVDLRKDHHFVHPEGHVQFRIHRIPEALLTEAQNAKGTYGAAQILQMVSPRMVLAGYVGETLGQTSRILFLLLGIGFGVALFFAGSLMNRKVTEGWHLRRLALEAKAKEATENSEQKRKN